MLRLIRYSFGLFLVIFPFSVRFAVYEPASFRFGNFNPWVTGFVYLPEVLLLAAFLLWVLHRLGEGERDLAFSGSWLWAVLAGFAANAFGVTFLKGDPMFGGIFLVRLLEVLAVFWMVREEVLPRRVVVRLLMTGASLQIAWGYLQWKFNGSLGLQLLGEAAIGPAIPGVAKTDVAEGVKQVRAYGSFLHPNILGAYLVLIYFLAYPYLTFSFRVFWLGVFLWGVYVSGSQAALFAGAAGLALNIGLALLPSASLRRAIALVFLVCLGMINVWFFMNSHRVRFEDPPLKERMEQNVISRNMWLSEPFGAGVASYTLVMEDHNADKLLPWEHQPVHNAYFLVLNETGIQGLLLLMGFLLLLFDYYWKEGRAVPVFLILLFAVADHFFWDSFSGWILIGLVGAFFALENQHRRFRVLHNDEVVE